MFSFYLGSTCIQVEHLLNMRASQCMSTILRQLFWKKQGYSKKIIYPQVKEIIYHKVKFIMYVHIHVYTYIILLIRIITKNLFLRISH